MTRNPKDAEQQAATTLVVGMVETPFTAAELAACARREVGKRRYVYPRQVEGKKLSQETADRELAMMEAIVNHFQALAEVTRGWVAP